MNIKKFIRSSCSVAEGDRNPLLGGVLRSRIRPERAMSYVAQGETLGRKPSHRIDALKERLIDALFQSESGALMSRS
jgi:hypothetical protein